ncbi:MAG TPA: hypothetical protein ENJ31_00070, partial [Anaerolineae bacterium]|nr:hypothetical protein [Anaerolineae bacterium]
MSEQRPWLVLFDADHIKEYVFATGRLKEIRGGSLTVERLTRRGTIEKHIQGTPGARLIYASGAAGKVRFAAEEEARAFQVWLEENYRRETVTGSLTSVRVPYVETFQETAKQGEKGLRRAKDARLGLAVYAPDGHGRWTLDGRRSAYQPASGPFSRYCQSCGGQPATTPYARGRRSEWLCAACAQKRRTVDRLRRKMRGDGDERLALEDDEYFGRPFLAFLQQEQPERWAAWRQAAFPQDLGALGHTSQPDNYLGFVYADGDRIGELLKGMKSEEDYQLVSTFLDEATREAAYAALGRHFRPVGGVSDADLAPFEVAMIGGDDLILLVAAHRALEVAVTFSREFSRRFAALSAAEGRDWQAAASVGVVLAHASQPILYLEQRAGELLKLAKKGRGDEAAVDYLVVASPTLNPVRRIRRQVYEHQDLHEKLYRTRRPYTLSELEWLLNQARKLKYGEAEGR